MRGIKLFFPFLDNLTISSDDSLCIHDEFLIHLINYFGRFLYALFWVKFYFISLRICIWFGSLSFSLTHDKKNQSRLSRKTHWKRIGWFMITQKSILYNHKWSTENHKFIFFCLRHKISNLFSSRHVPGIVYDNFMCAWNFYWNLINW